MSTLNATTIRTIILDGMTGASFGLRRDLSRIIALEMSEKGITSLRKALEKVEKLYQQKRKQQQRRRSTNVNTKGGSHA